MNIQQYHELIHDIQEVAEEIYNCQTACQFEDKPEIFDFSDCGDIFEGRE